MVTDSHSSLVRWRNHFSRPLNLHTVNEVRQTKIHTAEPSVTESSDFEVEMATEKLKRHKSPVLIKSQQKRFRKGQNNLL